MKGKEIDRYVIMNTTTAPASVWCKVEKKINKRPMIDLNSIELVEDTAPTFKDFMEEANSNGS